MNSKESIVGVIGSGSFGTAIGNLLSINQQVLIYSRSKDAVSQINNGQPRNGITFHKNVRATNDIQEVADTCEVIFPIVPSRNFRDMMRDLGPYLRPYHFLIHGTKGLDVSPYSDEDLMPTHTTIPFRMSRDDVFTMSEVIEQESSVVRIGCLSGPNLASEILAGQPAATLIASKYSEVIKVGQELLNSPLFYVFGSHDIIGAELAGALKNILAIGSGILGGLKLGRNIQSMLITRGLVEMIYIGKAMGSNTKAFLGIAGIGDLVATATSSNSRNYTVGLRIAQGEPLEDIIASSDELAEGLRTLLIAHQLIKTYKLHCPIMEVIYRVIYEKLPVKDGINYLMNFPYGVDVDFL